jgi:hypothetical protein
LSFFSRFPDSHFFQFFFFLNGNFNFRFDIPLFISPSFFFPLPSSSPHPSLILPSSSPHPPPESPERQRPSATSE